MDVSETPEPAGGGSPHRATGRDAAGDIRFAEDWRALVGAVRFRPERRVIGIMTAVLVGIIIANMVGQVWLNRWNGVFFDAIGRKDFQSFLMHLSMFVVIVAFLLTCVVSQTWLQERLKIHLRAAIGNRLLGEWLAPHRAYRLGFAGKDASAPDQRIQEDTRLLAELTAELGAGVIHSTLLLVSFIGILWGLSAGIKLPIGGKEVEIPGYLVWCALAYAGVGSFLTWIVGKPMIALNAERYAREAEFRFSLVRVNESAEAISLYGGERDERRLLDGDFARVLEAMRRLSTSLARLTWITSGYGWIALVFPLIAASPGYFKGSLTLGGLMMIVGAFAQVQLALRWFVDQFPRIADWRAALHRVAGFERAMRRIERQEPGEARIAISEHPEGLLAFRDVDIHLSDGSVIIAEATAVVHPGERVLITGESGSGKSTLFRTLAGIWPWGSGEIRTPPPGEMHFMPQRPYLPLGSLKAAACYPDPADSFDNAEVLAALERCGLGELIGGLHQVERWDKLLSLGQQQRLAFARLVLHKPRWVFMDEATAALDGPMQQRVMSLFDEELAGTTLLSIGHRPGLEAYHQRTLQVISTPDGGLLRQRPARHGTRNPFHGFAARLLGINHPPERG